MKDKSYGNKKLLLHTTRILNAIRIFRLIAWGFIVYHGQIKLLKVVTIHKKKNRFLGGFSH